MHAYFLYQVRRGEAKSPSEVIEDGDGRLGSEEKQLRSRLSFSRGHVSCSNIFTCALIADFMANTLKKLESQR